MIKAVFFDFDDTLVSKKNHTMINSTRKAIKLIQKKGIIPVIATGRPMYTIQKYIDELGIENAVFLNGHTVWNNKQVILDRLIERKKADAMFKVAYQNNLPYGLLTNEGTYLSVDSHGINDLKVIDEDYLPEELGNRDIEGNCLWIFADSSYDNILSKTAEKNDMRILRWGKEGIDVISKNVSKETGVSTLLENLGIDFSEIVSFGDGDNDIELIRASKIGVAMGNSSHILKETADFITDHIDNDGIYNALIKLGII